MEEAAARSSKKARGTAASSLAAFALRLAKHLSDVEGGGGGQNLVFSPLSIYATLALMSAGARGTTLNEVLAVLGSASRDEIAEFVSAVVERAFANRSSPPEEATKKINRWVSKATKHLTTSILPQGSVRSNTALVLANAIYFKGRWSMSFAKKDTETRPFQQLDGSYVNTLFMRDRND
ncbi:serpin-Z2B-like [Panicum virgatum]|uniref:serpin-Z2B-like n=1 Tax=Panicum virgatum TaxID=38727 RepID=UPI0019D55D7E|nr:serpin-Z2B-like [Panicum virgatum]